MNQPLAAQPSEARATAVVIGAGVVGCAVAHALAERGLETLVLERAARCGEGTSSRNSGVIHAGLYSPPGSLKASLCVRGKALLYEWCRAHGVPHRQTGKWIVGDAAEEEDLAALHGNALYAGATGLTRVAAGQLARELPGVRAEIGLFSAETGLVDPAALCRSLQAAAEERGARFVFHATISGIARGGAGYRLETSRGPIDAEVLVNSAGLYADDVARLAGLDSPRIHPCRGDYFALASAAEVPRQIVYPIRKRGSPGLGVHLTPALDGSLRLGPDARYVASKEDLGPPPELEARRLAFFEAARSYLPSLQLDQLRYDSCGLRPKLRAPDEPEERDFVISQELPGFVNLLGIESPGLTASLALAELVRRQILG
jgi:L-2-hydroxyglutarate oxidase LhgO